MGASQCQSEVCGSYEEIGNCNSKYNIEAIKQEIVQELERWRVKKIKLCVTGMSGAGKSKFVDAIRGLDYSKATEEQLSKFENAEAGSVNVENSSYVCLANAKIQLVEVAGIGSSDNPNLETYARSIQIHTFDAFLIVVDGKVTALQLQLAKKIKSMGKPFLLIRTKMDIVESNENKKKNPDVKLLKVRLQEYYTKEFGEFGLGDVEVFLISNYDRHKWDFDQLVVAIEKQLPYDLKETLISSLTTAAKEKIGSKIDVFKGQLWREVFFFLLLLPFDLITFGYVSYKIQKWRIKKKTKFYIQQLGLPANEDCQEFKAMKPEFGERMKELHHVNEEKDFCCSAFPFTGCYFFSATKKTLKNTLDKLKSMAEDLIDEATSEQH